MTTITSPTTPQFVQQAFHWDDLETNPVVSKAQAANDAMTANAPSANALSAIALSANALSAIGHSRSTRGSQPLSIQTFSTSTSARRGRCEHVGGILASVLERYGIGLDQLAAEIDGLK